MKRTFQKQIDENISTHLSLINLSNTLEKVITLLSKKIKNGVKYYYVEMEDQQQTLNICS